MARPTILAWFVAPLLLAAAGCGADDDPSSHVEGTASGAGGSDGTGGSFGGGTGGSGPPVCESPGMGSGAPEARADTAAVLSTDGRSVVMFGGDRATVVCGQTPKRDHVGDTWILDAGCGTWTQLSVPGPSPRARHAMALDASRNRAIVFGGRFKTAAATSYELYADVWAFDFATGTWAEVPTTGTAPAPRTNASAVVVGDELVVFGGSTSTSGLSFAPRNDAWALDLVQGTWREIAPSGPVPAARLFHAAAADPSTGKVYVHHGGDANAFTGPFLRDVWELDPVAGTWAELVADDGALDPVGRIKHGLLVKPGEGGAAPELVAFGGHDDGVLGNRNDVVSLSLGGAWARRLDGDVFNKAGSACSLPPDFVKVDLDSPERRSAFSFAARADGQAFVTFGGDSDCGRLNDVWWFDAVHGAWTQITHTLPGLTCPRTGATTWAGLCG